MLLRLIPFRTFQIDTNPINKLPISYDKVYHILDVLNVDFAKYGHDILVCNLDHTSKLVCFILHLGHYMLQYLEISQSKDMLFNFSQVRINYHLTVWNVFSVNFGCTCFLDLVYFESFHIFKNLSLNFISYLFAIIWLLRHSTLLR